MLPTNTWQAYNFYDRDGDGWGDTWYAGGNPPVELDSAVPRPRRTAAIQDLRPGLPAVARADRRRPPTSRPTTTSRRIATGDDLRARYDLVVFPGHSEYMTAHAVRRRSSGTATSAGGSIFLSANNFFWKVETDRIDAAAHQVVARRSAAPRRACCGVQYRANDDGRRQGPYTVVAAEAAPWLFDKTGLVTGSTFGETVGGYGIEIDTTTADSPPGTIVLARVVDLFGPGLSGEMTYYETEAGARVFSAGTLDFGGSATFWPISGCSRTSGATCSPTSSHRRRGPRAPSGG